MNDETKGRGVTTASPSAADEIEGLPKLQHELERLQGPEEAKLRILSMSVTRSHSGPLPSADEFEHYGIVEPTAPRTILDMAVKQQSHDHWMDKATLLSETVYRVLGMIAAAAIILGIVYIGYLLVLAGYPKIGSGLMVLGPLAGIAGSFIRGRDMTRLQNDRAKEEPPPPVKRQNRNRNKRK